MQINTGDKVRFLNETGGGIVTKIIDKDTVMVLNDEDEFEIPSLKRNLVVIESNSQQEVSSKSSSIQNSNTAKATSSTIEREDVYIAFVPKQGYVATDSPLDLYLINDTQEIILYTFYAENKGIFEGKTAGTLDANSKLLLTEYDKSDLEHINNLFFQILFYQQGEHINNLFFQILFYQQGTNLPKKPLVKNIKIQPVKFHKESSYKTSPYFHEQVILHQLTGEDLTQKLTQITDDEIQKVIREKEKIKHRRQQQPKIKSEDEPIETDLHINALVDSVVGMSNSDILEYQMNVFHETIRKYEGKKGQKLVFIHGIGNGTLKQKIHEALRRKYKKHYTQDASFKKYGYGATMVTIR